MEHKPTAKQPLLNNTLKLFMLAMILANTSSQMYDMLLPLYLKDLEANVAQVGLFFTLSRVFPLVLQILGGWISDSLGRLRSIAIGSVAGVFAYVVFILAPTWQWVLLAAAASSVTRSLIGPSFTAFIAEQSAPENRARVFGITGMLFTIVTVIGPPLGGWLAGAYGFKVMLICAGGLYTVAAVIRVGMARAAARGSEASPKKLSLESLRANLGAVAAMMTAGGLLTWILITDGALDIAFSTSFTLMPLYLEDIGRLSIEQISLLASIFGVFNMLVNIPAGWLADKKGERIAIALGFLVQFAAMLVFFQAGGFWGYAVVWALFGVGVALTGPAYQSLISKVVPERLRGTAFGFLHSSLGIFSLPAPAIGAQLWERISPRFPFQVMTGTLLVCVVPVWFKFRLPEEEGEAQ